MQKSNIFQIFSNFGTASLLILFTITVKSQPMSGSYTIGKGVSFDFQSPAQAIDSLHSKGISATVIFKIADGTYNGQLVMYPVKGSSINHKVVFESMNHDSSKVIIQYRSVVDYSNFSLKFLGADNIQFRYITLKSLSDTFARVVYISENSTNICFEHCHIEGRRPEIKYFSYSSSQSLVFSPLHFYPNDDSCVFSNCYFLNGYIAIELNGTSSTNTEKGTTIINNHFRNQFLTSVFAHSQSEINISGNFFESTKTDYFSAIAIYGASEGLKISNNRFIAESSLSGNVISLLNCKGNALKPSLIFNNIISLNSPDYNYSINSLHCVFNIYQCDSLEFYHNSAQIFGLNNTSKIINLSQNKNLILRNNIFANRANGICIYSLDTGLINWQSSHNFYYSEKTKSFYLKDYQNLKSWQNKFRTDSFSEFTNPEFISNKNLETFALNINNKGKAIHQIATDINGKLRNTLNPDPGAIEFEPLKKNLAFGQLIYPDNLFNCLNSDSFSIILSFINKGLDSMEIKNISISMKNPDTLFLVSINKWLKSGDTVLWNTKTRFKPKAGKITEGKVSFINNNDDYPKDDSLIFKAILNFKIEHFPFSEDFENGISSYFKLSSNEEANLTIDKRMPASGLYALHFSGNRLNSGWTGSHTATTANNAWIDNKNYHALAKTCQVNPGNNKHLRLSFKLKQTFSFGQKFSWFRLLLNDSIQLENMNGESNFNPLTNLDSFMQLCFDLSKFCDTSFTFTFQSACLTYDLYYQEGDNCFIDDIKLFEAPRFDACAEYISEPESGFCADSFNQISVKIRNTGYDTIKICPFRVRIFHNNDTTEIHDTVFQPVLPNKMIELFPGYLNTSNGGTFTIQLITSLKYDSNHSNNTFSKTIYIYPARGTPVIENFEGKDSLKNWDTKNMWVTYPGHHQAPSHCLSNSIWIQDSSGSAFYKSMTGPISKNTHLVFDYRIVSNPYPFNARQLTEKDSIQVLVATNCNKVYNCILKIDSSNHIVSDQMKRVILPLDAFEGKYIHFGLAVFSDSFNLTYFDFDSILIAELPVADAGRDTGFCHGKNLTYSADSISGCHYIWYNENLSQLISTFSTVNISKSGKYILEVTNSKGWKNYDTLSVVTYPDPSIKIDYQPKVCKGNYTDIVASGAHYYLWNHIYENDSFVVQINDTTHIHLLAINQFGCQHQDSIKIIPLQLPLINIIGPDSTCMNLYQTFKATGAEKYLWNNLISADSAKVLISFDTFIFLKGTDSNGCSHTISKKIIAKALPQPDLGKDTIICANKKFLLNPGKFDSYFWYDGDTSASKIIDSSGVGADSLRVWLTVSKLNCTATDSIWVIFKICCAINEQHQRIIKIISDPFNNEIILPTKGEKFISVELYDLNGKNLIRMENFDNQNNLKINTSSLNTGVYFIRLTSTHESVTLKIIIQNN